MVIVHLTASFLFGGPERQMLELARALSGDYRSVFLSFSEGGGCAEFFHEVRRHGFEALELRQSARRMFAAVGELHDALGQARADVLCCHGYKADILGLWAGRRAGIPVVAVSRGWTGQTLRVRLYEAVDRRILRRMDRVVCVSKGQAAKVRRAKVADEKIAVIRNAVRPERFADPDLGCREELQGFFAEPGSRIVGAAGRLSPEKGFEVLIEAARQVARHDRHVKFVLFGDGPLRGKLACQIADAGLIGTFVLAGFRNDLDRFLPFFDLLVLPSYTEGLPNIVLEALAASVPVVATAVGGTPEVVEDQASGFLVPPGQPDILAQRIREILENEERRREMGHHGREHILKNFTFAAQSRAYQELFRSLVPVPEDRRQTLLQKVG